MTDVERSILTRTSFRLLLRGGNALIAIVLAAFLTLHILAGTILQRAAPDGAVSAPKEPRASLYD